MSRTLLGKDQISGYFKAIETVAADQAAVNYLNSFDGDGHYRLVLSKVRPVANGVFPSFRFAVAGVAQNGASDYNYSAEQNAQASNASTLIRASSSALSNASGKSGNAIIDIFVSGNYAFMQGIFSFVGTSGNFFNAPFSGTYIGASGNITGVQFLYSSGNVDECNAELIKLF